MTTNRRPNRRGPRIKSSLHEMRLGGDTIRFELRRSARRTRTIHLRPEFDRVVLAVPMRTPVSHAREIIRKRADWILAHVGRTPPEPPRLIAGGCELPFMGRSLAVTVDDALVRRPAARPVDGALRVDVPMGLDDERREEAARQAVVEWLRAQAAERLPAEVERWWPRLGRGDGASVTIGNQRRQWGNCSHKGVMRFSWRVMTLEPDLIEYVVVHEMAHLTRMDHSKDFWAIVERALPDVKQRRRRLREVRDVLRL